MRYRTVIAIVAAFAAVFGFVGNKLAERKPRREDMHLPVRLLGLGIGAIGGGMALAVYGVIEKDWLLPMIFAAVLVIFGAAAVLCWKNQIIVMLDEERFVYRTMFGSEREYRFEDIQDMTGNRDHRLAMADGSKVFLESSAQMSDRLLAAIRGVFTARLEQAGMQADVHEDGSVTIRREE